MSENLQDRIFQRLSEIETRNLTRRLLPPQGIDLSSNDFLGLANDERLKDAFIKGIKQTGVGSTGSRLLRGERNEFAQIEKNFAAFKGAESSLYFSSGFQASVGLLQTFLEEGDVVFSDALNHASIIDGMRSSKAQKVIYPHLDYNFLAKQLREINSKGQKFLVIESLFSMDGDIAPLDKYAKLCRETNTNLIVDEAHAVGVYGEKGSGLIEEFGVEESVFLSLNTAGKALGCAGAFVAGSHWAIECLIQKCRSFIFSTAPPPALAYALQSSLEIIKSEPERREKLLKLPLFLRNLLRENGFDVSSENSQIIPILIGESEKAVQVAEKLQADGYDVRAIRPPTVAKRTSRLRISLNANLTERVLTGFVASLLKAIK